MFDFVTVLWQGACVENVLDSVVESLRRDSNRKFVFVEMVMKWRFFFFPAWSLVYTRFMDSLLHILFSLFLEYYLQVLTSINCFSCTSNRCMICYVQDTLLFYRNPKCSSALLYFLKIHTSNAVL
jgi:hypothetical protein